MAATSSNASFLSFGPNDSFISRSFLGLRQYVASTLLTYLLLTNSCLSRNLPSSLLRLLTTATEVHWASLGPVPESWLISYKDGSGRSSIRWGALLPQRLQTVLAKTWHSPHVRFFLGLDDSFLIWHPELIRWANLPPALEDALQSWLTPSGWRVGPPRLVTWGAEGAFFAMSEYGDVVYRVGEEESWEIFIETVEEWKAEAGFKWSEVAFMALDASTADQFVAVRNDGTWAGSIDDVNEDALEEFAVNFFARAKRRQKSGNSSTETQIGASANATLDPVAKALYEKWAKDTAEALAAALSALSTAPISPASTSSASSPPPLTTPLPSRPKPRKLQVRSPSSSSPTPIPTLLTTFPPLPAPYPHCTIPACVLLKATPTTLNTCTHDVETLLRGSGQYSYEFLRQERIRWHPDRFGRLCAEGWRKEGCKLAGEMFKILGGLMDILGGSKGDEGK